MAMSRADTFSSTQHPHLRVYLEPNKPLNECVDSRDGIALLMHFSCLCVLCFFLLHACNFASVIVISRKHTLAHKWIQFFVCVCVLCAKHFWYVSKCFCILAQYLLMNVEVSEWALPYRASSECEKLTFKSLCSSCVEIQGCTMQHWNGIFVNALAYTICFVLR